MKPTGQVLFVTDDAGVPGALDGEFDVVVAEGAVDAVKRLSSAPSTLECVVTRATASDLPLDAFLTRVGRVAPDAATVVVGGLPDDPEAATAIVEADAYVPPGREETLALRVRRIVEDRRVDRAVDRHDRLARSVATVSTAVAGAADREAVEAAVYEGLMDGAVYRQVWVGRLGDDGDDGDVHVTLPVAGRLDEADLRDLAGGEDPSYVTKAVRHGRVVSAEGRADTRGATMAAPNAVRNGRETAGLASAVVPFTDDGRVLGLGLVSTTAPHAFDASERELLADVGSVVGHALAALESADRSRSDRGDLTAGMGTLVHELRNPLGIARSHLELAREGDDAGSLEQVASALDRMVDTIDRVAAGVGAGQSVAETTVALDAVAHAAWEPLSTASANLEVTDSASMRADRDMAVRLLANLFQNAVDHGGESVTVWVGTVSDGFFVEDDGPGIPSEDRESVLERGFTTAEDGLGLGLSIVQTVVEAHGWSLSVTESEGEDGGARFEVSDVELVDDTADGETAHG